MGHSETDGAEAERQGLWCHMRAKGLPGCGARSCLRWGDKVLSEAWQSAEASQHWRMSVICFTFCIDLSGCSLEYGGVREWLSEWMVAAGLPCSLIKSQQGRASQLCRNQKAQKADWNLPRSECRCPWMLLWTAVCLARRGTRWPGEEPICEGSRGSNCPPQTILKKSVLQIFN